MMPATIETGYLDAAFTSASPVFPINVFAPEERLRLASASD
jgi:hypothetical protein